MTHEDYMGLAIEEAKRAAIEDEAPVGAIIVWQDKVIATAHNLRESAADPTAHAELLAIRAAAEHLGGWRLTGCTLYVTLEPCAMCSGAIINSRVDNVVFGAYDPKAGCCGSLYNLPEDTRFNHRPVVLGGIRAGECGQLLTEYFRAKRN